MVFFSDVFNHFFSKIKDRAAATKSIMALREIRFGVTWSLMLKFC